MSAESKTPLLGVTGCVQLEKNCTGRQPDYNDFDAVIHHVVRSSGVRTLVYRDFEYTVALHELIEVADGITFALVELAIDKDTGITKRMTCQLTSETRSAGEIREFIKKCRTEYEASRSNKLGDSLYYFNQTVANDANFSSAVSFSREPFTTNRSLATVFFEEKADIAARVELFLRRPEWYARRGIPHTLGFMFHGQPGCGKTSCIKALANETKRHIFNVKLGKITTETQLRNLFCNPVVQVINPETRNVERVTVPISRRLYVIEDIDAMTSLVHRREYKTVATSTAAPRAAARATPAKKPAIPELDGDAELESYFAETAIVERKELSIELRRDEEHDCITLDALLNILDGTLEIPDRILCITTNHPEVIDDALVRPGRVDAIVHFKYASRQIIREMYNAFYELSEPDSVFADLPDRVVSPATLNQIMLRYMRDPIVALAEIRKLKK